MIHLLRGINVGGHKKIPKEQLRECYERLGLQNVRTYIQSGNVVFDAAEIDNEDLEASIKEVTGFDVPGMLFTNDEWRVLMTKAPNAYKELDKEIKKYITLLQYEPTEDSVKALRDKLTPDETLSHYKRALFLHYPAGLKKPFFTNVALEKTLKQSGTTRNWNTMKALLKMIAD